MLQQIRRWILHFFINREIRRNIRVKKHVDFNEVQTVGVLFLLEDEKKFIQVDRIIKKLVQQGKRVKMIGYFPEKIMPSFYTQKLKIDIFTNKDTNLFGFPKSGAVKVFIERKFDLLIDFTEDDILPTDYILGMSNAGFKAGRYREDMVKVLDLMIKKPDDMSFEAFINSMIDYISILNTKKE
jgi:hypothetical protein